MTEPEQDHEPSVRAAEPVIRPRWRLPAVWLIPLVATAIGLWLVFTAYVGQGPSFVITFPNADGLEVGRTKIKCKEVEVGKVKSLKLSKDRSKVEVTAELTRDASELLSDKSRFWIVRARVSTSGISGLGTLLSGAYVAMDPGEPGKPATHYEGLDTPPIVTTNLGGQLVTLRAEKLGSINVGSPVYFRQIPVGEVVGYDLEPEGKSVAIKLFIRNPYDKLVHKDTRFWNVGGVEVTVDGNGVQMSSDSLIDLLLGGIAFENPVSLEANSTPSPDQVFPLYANHDRIYEKTYLDRRYYVLDFNESVRGLARGASVEFHGIKVGEVEDLKLEFNTTTLDAHVPVLIAIEPERLTLLGNTPSSMDKTLEQLVARGLRAQLKTGSMLTNTLFVDLDFYPKAPPRTLGQYGKYRQIPTIPSSMGALMSNLTGFLDQMKKLPLQDIANELKTSIPALRDTLQQASSLIKHLDKDTAPQAQATLAQAQATLATLDKVLRSDSPLQHDLGRTLDEFAKASRSLRDLVEMLERNPETLIWGKKKVPEP